MAVAVFNYALWAARYPELAGSVDPNLANALFMEACLRLDNSDTSIVTDPDQRLILLNMIIAHMASLSANGSGGLVGPIKSATEGSTSVSTALGEVSGDEAYWLSTPYGQAYWTMMAPFRSAQYVPAVQPYLGEFGYGLGGRWVPVWGSPAWPR